MNKKSPKGLLELEYADASPAAQLVESVIADVCWLGRMGCSRMPASNPGQPQPHEGSSRSANTSTLCIGLSR
jgi:hypothetical protein